MILSNLLLENYKKYTTFSMSFEEGLTGIIGRNGSGKSTIFDAITFALYGEMKTGKENIKNSKAGEKDNVSVSLEFEIDGLSYNVVRELRGKAQTAKAKLYKNDELISDGVVPVNSSVSHLVGMSKEAFLHTVFASQKELTALSGLRNEDRKKIIRKLLGLEKIDKVEFEIREKLKDLNRDIKSFNEILLSPEALKEIHSQQELLTKEEQAKVKESQTISKRFTNQTTALTALSKELEQFQKQKEALVKMQNDLSLLQQNQTHHNKTLSDVTSKLQQLETQAKQYQAEKSTLTLFTELESKIKTFQFNKEKMLQKVGLEKE